MWRTRTILMRAAEYIGVCATKCDKDFYEVEAGKLAIAKGQSDAVKAFGQQMVDAHTKTAEELKKIVQSENIKVALPAELDKKGGKLVADLNATADFDKTLYHATGQIPWAGSPPFCRLHQIRR